MHAEAGPRPTTPSPDPVGEGGGEGHPATALAVEIDPALERAATARPHQPRPGEPLYRPLRIYALDPAASALEGSTATVNVPYEPLPAGPRGALFEVDATDGAHGVRYRGAELDAPAVLLTDGYAPSSADPRFHQQMVYAVCSLVYDAFRRALGRDLAWSFARPADADGTRRLRLRPFAARARNAFYDPATGEICFGYYRADAAVTGRSLPGGYVFTALSHDVVAHEVTHALLDGLRAHFTYPSGPDVLAFHEGFADLVAVFQHFSYRPVVEAALRQARGQLGRAALLADLARQFGHTTGAGAALRTALPLAPDGTLRADAYDPAAEPHALGAVLLAAVFEAFATVFSRKTERYVRLATGGTGVLPPGELPGELVAVLAEEATQLAGQFLALCIRAIDYCPPVDLQLGDYLRAVLTADRDLVPDDRWGYREAWIDAFARRRLYPAHVGSLAAEALAWQPPEQPIPPVEALGFAALKFRGDPACPADPAELRRQAAALAAVVALHPEPFGIAGPDDPRLRGDTLSPPVVHSIRAARRAGPDGRVVFDLVAEVTQRRRVREGAREFDVLGGATAILGPAGEVRYLIAKHVLNEARRERQRAFLAGDGARYWQPGDAGRLRPAAQLFRLLHAGDAAG